MDDDAAAAARSSRDACHAFTFFETADDFSRIEDLPMSAEEQLQQEARYLAPSPHQHTVYRDGEWHLQWDVWRPDCRPGSALIATCAIPLSSSAGGAPMKLRCIRDLRLRHIPALCSLAVRIRTLTRFKLSWARVYVMYRPRPWVLTVHIHNPNVPLLQGVCYHLLDLLVTMLTTPDFLHTGTLLACNSRPQQQCSGADKQQQQRRRRSAMVPLLPTIDEHAATAPDS